MASRCNAGYLWTLASFDLIWNMKRLKLSPPRFPIVAFDKPLLFTVLALVVFGVVMVANASVVDATRTFGDELFFAKRQFLRALGGLSLLFLLARVPYRVWNKFALPLLGTTLLLLVFVLIPGLGTQAQGARRWIDLGIIDFQPAELAKFTLCIYFAHLFSRRRAILPFLFALTAVVGLVMFEPDLGTATVIVFFSAVIYFASGAPLTYFLALLPLGLVSAVIFIITSSYRKERLLTFFNPTSDPQGASYHIRQVLIALGSGGLFGLGLGQSRQKYLFLPEPATDSIFAIIGEELGFIGGAVVIALFAYLVWRGFLIATRAKDAFGRLLAVGITAWIGIQAFINLAAMVALVPLTGVPLPFLSYGGSALIFNLAALGILLNISRKN